MGLSEKKTLTAKESDFETRGKYNLAEPDGLGPKSKLEVWH